MSATKWSKASAPIRAIVSGYSSEVRARKLLVILQAYVDDSASDAGDRRLFLAGYVSTAENWAQFSDLWADALAARPSISYLKMSEARALQGEFRGWRGEDRDRKVRKLANIIRQLRPLSIHASVSRSRVEDILKPVVPYVISNPYALCFSAIMMPMAAEQARLKTNVPIDFIFDSQEGLGEEARTIYRLMREAQPEPIRNALSVDPLFRDDKLVMPLQAADMLAWHVRRRYERLDHGAWFVPAYLSVEDGLHVAIDLEDEHLENMSKGLAEILGNAPTRKKDWKAAVNELDRLRILGLLPK